MKKITKNRKKIIESGFDKNMLGSLDEALGFVVKNAAARFDESVSIDIVLGIDPSKGEQSVRGATLLPHGIGKEMRVLAFVKEDRVNEAKSAGADYAGLEDFIEKIKGGWLDFDASVATSDVMIKLGPIAKILGPRNLLPNKKVGTVTDDIKKIIEELKKGRLAFKNDKGGGLHISFGKVSFGVDKLKENVISLVKTICASKPISSKGRFIKKVSISSTMGFGVNLNPDLLNT